MAPENQRGFGWFEFFFITVHLLFFWGALIFFGWDIEEATVQTVVVLGFYLLLQWSGVGRKLTEAFEATPCAPWFKSLVVRLFLFILSLLRK